MQLGGRPSRRRVRLEVIRQRELKEREREREREMGEAVSESGGIYGTET